MFLLFDLEEFEFIFSAASLSTCKSVWLVMRVLYVSVCVFVFVVGGGMSLFCVTGGFH